MDRSALLQAVSALVADGSMTEGDQLARRGFHVEVEASKASIVALAATYRGAGYFLELITAVDRDDFRELWYQFNRLGGEPDRHLLRVQADDERVPSISAVYGAANWLEREAFDMMGITFEGHPYPVRLLLPEDADFHPLRRDQCIDDELRVKRAKQRTKLLKEREKAAAKAAAALEASAKPDPEAAS